MRLALPRLLVVWLSLAIAMLTQPTSSPRRGDHDEAAQPDRSDVAANSSRRADFTAAADKRAVDHDDNDLVASLVGPRFVATSDAPPTHGCVAGSTTLLSVRSAAASPRGPPITG